MISLHTDAVKEIRLHHKRGAQVHELSDAYGVSRQCVWKIVTRRTHKRVLDLPDGTDIPLLRQVQRRTRSMVGYTPPRPAPPADPPPLPVAPPRPTAAALEAASRAQEVKSREDAVRRQAERLAKARETLDRRSCPPHACTVLYLCPCHAATNADDRAAASANCDGGKYCQCRCHRRDMPAIVLEEDVPAYMLSFWA